MVKCIIVCSKEENTSMNILKFKVNDIVELKKQHPCGGSKFRIVRVGSIMRITCETCEHSMEIDRIKLEKATKKIIMQEEKDDNASK